MVGMDLNTDGVQVIKEATYNIAYKKLRIKC